MVVKAAATHPAPTAAKATVHAPTLAQVVAKVMQTGATPSHAATAVAVHSAVAPVVAKMLRVARAATTAAKVLDLNAATRHLVTRQDATQEVANAKTASVVSLATTAVRVSQTHFAPALMR